MKPINPQQEKILQTIDSASDTILSISHRIHAHPELGYEEKYASALLSESLEKFGFRVERGYAGIPTAFCARRGNGNGPGVAFLAEYDALPDLGHACGHNVIAASALAAGVGLGGLMDEIAGEVWVVGTPAEETSGAKVTMVERGAFSHLEAALMVHPHAGNFYTTESLALDAIEVEFFGKPSHAAAAPWEGVNALDALLVTFNSINSLRQQVRPDARIHGIITKGGAAPNIIPDHTVGRFYLRAKQRTYLDKLKQKFLSCVEGAATSTGTTFTTREYEFSFDDMQNNLVLAERMRDYLGEFLGVKKIERAPEFFGSIDMGNVSHTLPAVHVLVDITQGQPIPPHTREFQQAAATPHADANILRSGKALALTGYDVLVNPDFRALAWAEFKDNQPGA